MASRRFLQPDLGGLPEPVLIEELDAEAIISEMQAAALSKWEDIRSVRPDLPSLDFIRLETEPLNILMQVWAAREVTMRAMVNDKARAVLLAKAKYSDLDHIGVDRGVERALIEPGDGVTSADVMEDDERLRRRIQLAPEAFSVAGPAGAYEFHALTIDPSVMDAHAYSPEPGRVHVAVVGQDAQPVSDAVFVKLIRRFTQDDLVPLTDVVSVLHASVVSYDVTIKATAPAGSDLNAMKQAIEAGVLAYQKKRALLGNSIRRSMLMGSAALPGLEQFDMSSPASDIVCQPNQIAWIGNLNVEVRQHIEGQTFPW